MAQGSTSFNLNDQFSIRPRKADRALCSQTLPKKVRSVAGFTLLELLIVIAIIGLLASVVLLRYPFTIERVKDSRVISDLSQFRTQAGILYTASNESYQEVANCSIISSVCYCADPDLDALCKDAQDYSDQDLVIFVNSDLKGYCIFAHLQDYDEYYCIDGAGHIKRYAAFPAFCTAACSASDSCRCE